MNVRLFKKAVFRAYRLIKYKRAVYGSIGARNHISKGVYFGEKARIGNSNFVGERVKIINADIRNYCSIADDVKIGLMEHDTNCISTNFRIFDPVWGLSKHTGYTKPDSY